MVPRLVPALYARLCFFHEDRKVHVLPSVEELLSLFALP